MTTSVKIRMSFLLTSVLGSGCWFGTCGDEPWEGTYRGSSNRKVFNCTEPVGNAPNADKVVVTKGDESGRFEVQIAATNNPNCTLSMRTCDFNVAMVEAAEQCEGEVAPEGFSLHYNSSMSRLQGSLRIFLTWQNDINPDCRVEDDWILASR